MMYPLADRRITSPMFWAAIQNNYMKMFIRPDIYVYTRTKAAPAPANWQLTEHYNLVESVPSCYRPEATACPSASVASPPNRHGNDRIANSSSPET